MQLKSFKNKTYSNILTKTWNYCLENSFLIFAGFILLVSFFTHFLNYQNPALPIWDETYHISSGQKYVEGKYFVELHPPLGKLLIGLGEKLLSPNQDSEIREKQKEFVKTEELDGEDLDGVSYEGYRFFPALLAFFTPFFFYLILYKICPKPWLNFIFTLPFLFENGMIMHFRAAMLEGIQLFFILLSLLAFLNIYQKKGYKIRDFILFGLTVGLTFSVKINGLVLGFLVIPICLKYLWHNTNFHSKQNLKLDKISVKNYLKNQLSFKVLKTQLNQFRKTYSKLFYCLSAFGFVFFFSFLGVQYIHQITAKEYLSETNYRFSEERYKDNPYLETLDNQMKEMHTDDKAVYNPINVYKTTLKWYFHQKIHTEGVPELDLSKGDKENGSYPSNWLVGNKSISYRWEKEAILKSAHKIYPWQNWFQPVDEEDKITLGEYNKLSKSEQKDYVIVVEYLYLINNPITLLTGIIGLILGFGLMLSYYIFGNKIEGNKVKKTFNLIQIFTGLYSFYMIAVLQVSRVLYLYHYFIPLTFSLILTFLITHFLLQSKQIDLEKNFYLKLSIASFGILVFTSFIFFSPFTYHWPLSFDDFEQRNWFSFWLLKNVG